MRYSTLILCFAYTYKMTHLLSDYIIVQCLLEYTFYEVFCYYARQVILMETNSNKKVIVLKYISSEESNL